MNNFTLLSAFHHTLLCIMGTICLITLPILIVGLAISILQAATQINEMTMTFIPKLVVMFIILLVSVPWLLENLVQMTQQMMYNLPNYIK